MMTQATMRAFLKFFISNSVRGFAACYAPIVAKYYAKQLFKFTCFFHHLSLKRGAAFAIAALTALGAFKTGAACHLKQVRNTKLTTSRVICIRVMTGLDTSYRQVFHRDLAHSWP